jgi:pimeloyl-ACP methyl ester carboxylesterase
VTFLLVHGAWHGAWSWERVIPRLEAAGAGAIAPQLTLERDVGLDDHVDEVLTALGPSSGREVVLVGHSYAGLVVRQAADLRPERVSHVVLVDGWAGGHGESMFSLAPHWFSDGIRAAAESNGGSHIPAPEPAAFGIKDVQDAAWLEQRLRPHPLRTFADRTRLSGAVDSIPGTGVHCRPATFPFRGFAQDVGYTTVALDGPHDVMLARPDALARELLQVAA